jgi:hypothetical protein
MVTDLRVKALEQMLQIYDGGAVCDRAWRVRCSFRIKLFPQPSKVQICLSETRCSIRHWERAVYSVISLTNDDVEVFVFRTFRC